MNQHPYLRAYMAGIVVPTLLMLVGLTAFTIARCVYNLPLAVERIIVFPMAVVPNLWGLWNIIYIGALARRHVPIGVFGALLPFVLAPGVYLVTRLLGFAVPPFITSALPFAFPIGVALYYLVWKHIVGALNGIVGVG